MPVLMAWQSPTIVLSPWNQNQPACRHAASDLGGGKGGNEWVGISVLRCRLPSLPCSEHTGLGICTVSDTITSLLRSAGILSRLCRPCQGVSHEMQNPSEKERCKMDWRRQRISRARNEHEWLLSLFSLPLPLIFIVPILKAPWKSSN